MRGPGEVFPTTVEVTADVPVPLHGRVIAGRSVAQPALHVRWEPGGGGFFIPKTKRKCSKPTAKPTPVENVKISGFPIG